MNGTQPDKQSDPVATDADGMVLDRLRRRCSRDSSSHTSGHLAAAVELFDQTDQCVREVALARGPGTVGAAEQASANSNESWRGIERLYRELSVALTAQRNEVSVALNTIRQSKKALKTYGNCLSST
jgi:hypothetical protein